MDVWLYIVIFSWGSAIQHRYPMENIEACERAAASVTANISQGDESEAGIAAYCANDKGERYFKSTWWTDNRKHVDD